VATSEVATRPTDEHTRRRRVVLAAVLTLALLGSFFVGLQVLLEWDEGCSLTPDGYFGQVVVRQEQHLLWTTCRLDPGNGEPEYVIHRPWQSVRGS
jgi:hypothetical protein